MPVISPSLLPTIYGQDRFPDDWGLDAQIALTKIHQGWKSVADAQADILSDETLTPSARLVALDRLFEDRVSKHTDQARKALEAARNAPQQWRENIAALFKPSNDPADIALAGEIRTALRTMPQEDREAALARARVAGDLTVIRAATSGPEFLTGISADKSEGLRLSYTRDHFPEFLDRLEEAERFARTAEGSLAALRDVRQSLFSKGDEAAIESARTSAAKTARHTAPASESD